MYLIGADIGQAVDYTALAVIENQESSALRHIERLPLGTSYPDVVTHLAGMQAQLSGSRLILDHTGVGRPVADMLTEKNVPFVPVSITGGKSTRCVDGVWRVPKRTLMHGLAGALETEQLKIAHGLPYIDILQAELKDFMVSISAAGHDSYNGKTEHDDLVIAVALAMWRAGVEN